MWTNPFRPPATQQEFKFSINEPNTAYALALSVRAMLHQADARQRPIIVLCIGTDRSTGDALGPLTGSKLQGQLNGTAVYGTLDEPVHATNLVTILQTISRCQGEPFILAIDACLGKVDSVGCVTLGHGPLKPGAAVNKSLPEIGHAHITGIVNVGGFMEHLVLQSTRLSLVMRMAEIIACGVSWGLRQFHAE